MLGSRAGFRPGAWSVAQFWVSGTILKSIWQLCKGGGNMASHDWNGEYRRWDTRKEFYLARVGEGSLAIAYGGFNGLEGG